MEDAELFAAVAEMQRTQERHFRSLNDAAILFGEEWAKGARHEERVARINATIRGWWQEKGGTGAHPMEYQP